MDRPAFRVVLARGLTQPIAGRGRFLVAALLLLGATVVIFEPLVASFHTAVLAAEYSDARNGVRGVWLVEHLHSTPFTIQRDPFNGAPEGTPLVPAVNLASPLQPLFMWALAPVVGLIASLNLFLLLGVAATGFAAFVLFDQLGFAFLPGLIGGYLIAFNPWSIDRAVAGAPAFNHGWCLLLLVAALTRLLRRPTLISAALAGAAYASCFLVAAYFGLVGLTFVLAYAGIAFARSDGWPGRVETVKRLAVMAGVTVTPLIPALIVFVLDRKQAAQTLNNPVTQLTQLGASPFASYLLPSPRHPFLGHLANSLRPSDPLHEKVLFFGYATIALAVAGAVMLVRRHAFAQRQRTAMTLAVVTAPIAFLLSLPSVIEVLGVRFATPTYVAGLFTSYYRVYARVGYGLGIAVVLLAVAVLTHIGSRRHGRLLVIVLGALMVFECLPGTVAVIAANRAPRYDAWIATQPAGIVAHYPLPTDNELAIILERDEYYNQRFTRHPNFALFGAGIGGTREEGIRLLARYITDPVTPRILAAEGVRYVVIHDDVYRALHADPPLVDPPFFTHAVTFGDVRIYRITPHPNSHFLDKLLIKQAPTIAALEGLRFGTVTVGPGGFNGAERYHDVPGWHWMTQNGSVLVENPYDHPMKFRLVGHTFSNTVPRTVEIGSNTGQTIASFKVSPFERGLNIRPLVLAPGVTDLNFHATPDPQQLGGGDERQGSIFLSPLRAVPLNEVSLRAR
jgi:hypothetical protein